MNKIDKLLSQMWGIQDLFVESADTIWQERIGSLVDASVSAVAKSPRIAPVALDNLEKAVSDLGKDPDVIDLFEDLTRTMYALGAMFIDERDAQIRQNASKPALDKTINAQIAKAATPDVTVGFKFDLVDEDALRGLKTQALLWVTDDSGTQHFDAATRAVILEEAQKLIEQGFSGERIAGAFKAAIEAKLGVGAFAKRGMTYWAGVAEHAATTAGIRGQLSRMESIGWTRYEIVNPMDDRTTEICRYMNGKTFDVEPSVQLFDRLMGASTVDDVKLIKPFAKGGSSAEPAKILGSKVPFGPAKLSSAQSKSLGDGGWSIPPFHFRCRSYIDIAWDQDGEIPGA